MGGHLGRSFLAVVGRLNARKEKSTDFPVGCERPRLPRDGQPVRVSLAGITVGKGCPGWRRAGQSEWQELSGGEGTLQSSLFAGQRGDSAQVFPDFDELRGVVLFSLRWVFQLVQSLLTSQQLLLERTL